MFELVKFIELNISIFEIELLFIFSVVVAVLIARNVPVGIPFTSRACKSFDNVMLAFPIIFESVKLPDTEFLEIVEIVETVFAKIRLVEAV